MRYFLDTEFIERPGCIDLISIGIVCEDGREYYAESSEVDWSKASRWVLENVCPHLKDGFGIAAVDRQTIRDQVLEFAPPEAKPEFWGYFADYDWVVFCWLFGTMMDLPDGYPMYCRDIRQWAEQADLHDELPSQYEDEHHALADARWNREAWTLLAESASA